MAKKPPYQVTTVPQPSRGTNAPRHFAFRIEKARTDVTRNLYHWRKASALADRFFLEKMKEADSAYNLELGMGSEQSDWYYKLMDYAQRIRWRLEKFEPGTQEFNEALLQVAAWYAAEEGMDQSLYRAGTLVKAQVNWHGYVSSEPWATFEPGLLLKADLDGAEQFEAGASGMVIGEKLTIQIGSSDKARNAKRDISVRFQKAILATLTYTGGESIGYGPDTNPLGPPDALEGPKKTKTLVCYYNPLRSPGNFPFVEWKQD